MAVGEAQGDGFFGAERGVVQAAEESDHSSGRVRATASSSMLT
jgi:hypothetical protein